MSMSQEEMLQLAERISKLGKNVGIQDFMGALGLVMFHSFLQFDHADRLHAVTAWTGALFNQLSREEHKRKAN